MDANIRVTFSLNELTPTEFNLIGLALAGRLKPDQMADAAALNRKMIEQRRKAHMDHVALCDGILKSLDQQG